MPFDRLVAAIDSWAGCNPDIEVQAQIGKTHFKPLHLNAIESLSSSAFSEACQRAKLIIAHAGMGSILTAMQYSKPIVVMPRKGSLRETRNDHQVAAGKWLSTLQGVYFASDESELDSKIHLAIKYSLSPRPITSQASKELIDGLTRFVEGTEYPIQE
tara:strand:+ start:1572 stop:2045 length:474 start_codon:yes stop_codon:yes gene_type:complete